MSRIKRFGLEAVTGRRVFLYVEYIRMITAENIVTAYHSRQSTENWTQWANDNPELNKIIFEAMKLSDG